ncbi:MAG: AAA family ATPase [Sedimentisphaerales bacterium]|nr:AAA family ATPase [Sedimentisphaerales bacterium]
MIQAISKLTIKGYKSIRSLEDFELRNLNILIGPNGAGKSNFLEFFRILEEISKGEENLQRYVSYMGGADKLLYLGSKATPFAEVAIWTDNACTHFELKATQVGKLEYLQMQTTETTGLDEAHRNARFDLLRERIYRNHKFYHFHDTSDLAAVKRPSSKRDYEYLRPDASNLVAFLLRLKKKHPKDYAYIREVIQLAAPFFDDFWLREEDDKDDILLEWRQKGSDYPFHPSQISDGTLRFICLATALLQPNPPSTILLDEPELGLHPYALALLAGLIQKATFKAQVIISTQSASLIDHFKPEDIILVERKNDESVFSRPDTVKLKIWLEEYSLGDIWSRNILEGTADQ